MVQILEFLLFTTVATALTYCFWLFLFKIWPKISGERTLGPGASVVSSQFHKHFIALACLFAVVFSLVIATGFAQRIVFTTPH